MDRGTRDLHQYFQSEPVYTPSKKVLRLSAELLLDKKKTSKKKKRK